MSDSRIEKLPLDTILQGDVRQILPTLPASSVDLIVTSPPYFGLREYTDDSHEIGREQELGMYIHRIKEVAFELHRMAKPTASFWINIDDTYDNGQPLLVTERMMLAILETGWKLVNKVIWFKIGTAPESAARRFNRVYEMFYWFVKNQKLYYFNNEAAKIPVAAASVERLEYKFNKGKSSDVSRMKSMLGDQRHRAEIALEKGVGCGDVWAIVTSKEKVAHIAPYPDDLLLRPIVGCSPPGGVVFDPFMGSGTTAKVAKMFGRHYCGTELNPDSVKEATARLAVSEGMDLFSEVIEEEKNAREGTEQLDFGSSNGDGDHGGGWFAPAEGVEAPAGRKPLKPKRAAPQPAPEAPRTVDLSGPKPAEDLFF
jgi:DNA modification methylase